MPNIKFKNVLFIILGAAIFSFGFINFNVQNELEKAALQGSL